MITIQVSMELSINVSLSQEITDLADKALHDGDGQEEEEEDRRVLILILSPLEIIQYKPEVYLFALRGFPTWFSLYLK